jgi:Membrane-bound toxin component of toxin-antitoxin system
VQFPVFIELYRSQHLSLLLVLFHAIAAGCVIALPWPLSLHSLLIVIIGLSLWQALRPSRIVGLHLSGKNALECVLVDGNRVGVTPLPDSTVFLGLIVMRLRIGEEKRVSSLALLPDHMSADQFRMLRLWLRWHAVSDADTN